MDCLGAPGRAVHTTTNCSTKRWVHRVEHAGRSSVGDVTRHACRTETGDGVRVGQLVSTPTGQEDQPDDKRNETDEKVVVAEPVRSAPRQQVGVVEQKIDQSKSEHAQDHWSVPYG